MLHTLTVVNETLMGKWLLFHTEMISAPLGNVFLRGELQKDTKMQISKPDAHQ